MNSLLYSPMPNQSIVAASGAVYTSDNNHIISNPASDADVTSLQAAGCFVLTPPPTGLVGKLLQANFDVTSDQQIPLNFSGANFRITKIVVLNASTSLTTAAGGVYTAAAKATGQGVLVASGQVYSSLTNAVTALNLTLALPNLVLTAGTFLYLSLTTAQGAPCTADVYVYGEVYD